MRTNNHAEARRGAADTRTHRTTVLASFASQAGDVIQDIQGEAVAGWSLDRVVNLLRTLDTTIVLGIAALAPPATEAALAAPAAKPSVGDDVAGPPQPARHEGYPAV